MRCDTTKLSWHVAWYSLLKCDPVWQKGTYSLSNYTTLRVCNFIIVADICLEFPQTILLWWYCIVCKHHCKKPFSKKVMSSQNWKSGKAISPFCQTGSQMWLWVLVLSNIPTANCKVCLLIVEWHSTNRVLFLIQVWNFPHK